MLAVVQLVLPATSSWMQVGLAVILLQTPGWVLRKSPHVDQDALGLHFGALQRTAALAGLTMLVVFPLFAAGYHVVQTELLDRRAGWSTQALVRWDETLEYRPHQPCGRADGSASVWLDSGAVWLVGPPAEQLTVRVTTDPPTERGLSVVCVPGRPPQAKREMRPRRDGTFRLSQGTGLWVSLKDRDAFHMEIRGGDGVPLPTERLRLGGNRVEADEDGVVEDERAIWWLLSYIVVHLGLVALPEEWFFRGYLHGRLDQRMGTPWRLFGANVGWGLVLSALAFALLHPILLPGVHRLLVFFPALLFGWLRARSGNVGAAILVHAGSNVLLAIVSRMYL